MFSPSLRLDRPYDDRTHARRPSDEGERILRKISGMTLLAVVVVLTISDILVGAGFSSLDTSIPSRHLSFPSEDSTGIDLVRSNDVLGLADTGRMISNALSDSFLSAIGMDDTSVRINNDTY